MPTVVTSCTCYELWHKTGKPTYRCCFLWTQRGEGGRRKERLLAVSPLLVLLSTFVFCSDILSLFWILFFILTPWNCCFFGPLLISSNAEQETKDFLIVSGHVSCKVRFYTCSPCTVMFILWMLRGAITSMPSNANTTWVRQSIFKCISC